MDYKILVNKDNPLCIDYVPNNLIATEYSNLEEETLTKISATIYPYYIKMMLSARKKGFNIIINSGYRGATYQQEIWDYYEEKIGLEETRKRVAVPGTSEHQTGLAIDLIYIVDGKIVDEVTDSQEETKWLKENAHKYGFILRYPKGKEEITGYNYEPWHYRFVGVELATSLYEENITLEEYYLKDKIKAKAK